MSIEEVDQQLTELGKPKGTQQLFYFGLLNQQLDAFTKWTQARDVFDGARAEVDTWLKSVLGPLSLQIKEHEALLTRRVAGFRKVAEKLNTLQGRMRDLAAQKNALRESHADLMGVKRVIASHEDTTTAIHAA